MLDPIWEHIISGRYVPPEDSPAWRILDRYNRELYPKHGSGIDPSPDDKTTLARVLAGFTIEEQQAALSDYALSVLKIKERERERSEQTRRDEEAQVRWEAERPQREAAERAAAEAKARADAEAADAARIERERRDAEQARIALEQAIAKEKSKIEIHAEATRQIEQSAAGDLVAEARVKLRPVPSAAFLPATEEDGRSWLVEGIAVAGEPLLIGGPKKTLKTSLAVDLAISLSTGSPFLGRFNVPRPRSVVLFSGESGRFTLASTTRRIAEAKNVNIAEAPLSWQTTLPNLSNAASVEALRAECEPFDVVIVDPLYRALGTGVNPANLFDVGSTLGNVSDALAGKTLIILHHTVKDTWERKTLDLSDLAFAGVQEWARQWFLINRRKRFDPGQATDLHRLIVAFGGSAGHSGSLALDVDEGKLTSDFAGRQWLVTVRTAEEAREADRAAKTAKAASKPVALADALIAALPADGSPISFTAARNKIGRNSTDFKSIVAAAVAAGRVIEDRDGNRRSLRLALAA